MPAGISGPPGSNRWDCAENGVRVKPSLASATLAWELAREPREHVLAALTISRCGPAEAWIKKAHEVADRADDQNLLTAVAKAARMAGVVLDVLPPTR